MNKTMKTTLVIAGTAVATGVALNYITDGAVKESLTDLIHKTKNTVVDAAEATADTVEL